DSSGFEDDALYPKGGLQPVEDGASSWHPSADPATIVAVGPPYDKALRRALGTDYLARARLPYSAACGGILIVEMDVRVTNANVRTLDLSLMPESGGLQASFLG